MEPESQQNNGSTDALRTDNGVDAVAETSSQTNDPIVSNSTPSQLPANGKKKFGKKTGLLIGIGVAVIALAGSASAYQFWYQNPDKVIADAISHMMATKQAQVTGDIVIESEDVRVAVAIKTNGDEENTSASADVVITPKTEETKFLGDIKLGGEAIVASNGDLYFKVKDLKPTVDKLIDTGMQMQVDEYEKQGYKMDEGELDDLRAEVSKSIDPIMNKIDNRWIKVTADDLKQEGDDEQACIMDVIEKINNDNAMRQQLVDTYKAHKFVLVDKELGVKDGAIGYQLKIDETAAEAFGEAAKNTTFGSELKKCDEDIFEETGDVASPATDDDAEVTTEVWITRWSHQLRALKVSIDDKDEKITGVIDLDFVMGTSDEITIPTDTTSITELQDDISELLSGAAGAASLSI